jgi:hypothetical protein
MLRHRILSCQAAELLTGSIRKFGNLTLTGLSTLSGQRVTDLTGSTEAADRAGLVLFQLCQV